VLVVGVQFRSLWGKPGFLLVNRATCLYLRNVDPHGNKRLLGLIVLVA
jgi:hypothetical protein